MSQSSEQSTRVTNSEKGSHGNLIAKVVLFLLCCIPSLLAQAAPGRAAGKESTKTVVPAASTIQFENVVEQSKIKFKLKNSISPQRYTFETMAGGVAVFDYNNDGLLDIFFPKGAALPPPSLESVGEGLIV